MEVAVVVCRAGRRRCVSRVSVSRLPRRRDGRIGRSPLSSCARRDGRIGGSPLSSCARRDARIGESPSSSCAVASLGGSPPSSYARAPVRRRVRLGIIVGEEREREREGEG